MIKMVAVEGLDCVGKSSFCTKLAKFIESQVLEEYKGKVRVLVQHFPDYDSYKGNEIKKIITSTNGNELNQVDRKMLAKLFIANMKSWVEKEYYDIICEDKDNNFTIIIFDRYMFSTHLYYVPYASGTIESEVRKIYELQRSANLPEAHKYIFIEATPKLLASRLSAKIK